MPSIREITREEMCALAGEWNLLVQTMPFPSFFCSWEWIDSWWEHYGKLCRPLVLGVYDHNRLLGIVPMALRRSFFDGGWRTGHILELCGREVASDHMDIISSRADSLACIEILTEYLAKQRWDLLHLSHYAGSGNIDQWMSQSRSTCVTGPRIVSKAPYLAVIGDFEKYEKVQLRERGAGIRRKSRRLKDIGITYREDVDHKIGLDVLFDLHKKRAQAKRINSAILSTNVKEFHVSLAEKISKKGQLFLRFLGDERQFIAGFYGFVSGKRLLYYQIGHEPEYDRFSPGAVLMYHVVREAFERGFEEVDFLRGGESYKDIWANHQRYLFTVTVRNNSIKGRLSHTAYAVHQYLKVARRQLGTVCTSRRNPS